jgi:branched-chain amino acid transport system permease protein
VLLVIVLVWRPNGLFASRRQTPPEPMTGTFIAPSRPIRIPGTALAGAAAAAALVPLVLPHPYVLQTLINSWLYALLGLSLTLIAGTVGLVSLGHAALLAIGGYSSALLALDFGVPVGLAILSAGLIAAFLGTVLVFPSFRLRGHYLSIATLAIGEIVSLVILNWEGLTRGPIGVSGIPPLSLFGVELDSDRSVYWFTLAVLVVLAALQFRLLGSHLGRVLRAVRDDDVAARSYGIRLDRYKALAFAVGSFAAGLSGGITSHLYSYINHETFNAQLSILALTIVILGGMGNVTGAIVGSVLLVGLPEVFRVAAEYRVLIYGLVLLLLVRFRPQGLLGTV